LQIKLDKRQPYTKGETTNITIQKLRIHTTGNKTCKTRKQT